MKLLNIQDKYITIYNVEFIDNTNLIYAEQLRNEETSYPECRSGSLTKNNNSLRKIKHTPIIGCP